MIREGDSALNPFLIASGRALGILQEHPRTATVIADSELTCMLIARLHGLTPHEHGRQRGGDD